MRIWIQNPIPSPQSAPGTRTAGELALPFLQGTLVHGVFACVRSPANKKDPESVFGIQFHFVGASGQPVERHTERVGHAGGEFDAGD